MTNKEYAQGLRKLAEIYEDNPDITLPYEGDLGPVLVFTYTAEEFARTVAAFGNGIKRFDNNVLVFMPDVAGLRVEVRCDREKVCERRVVGKKHIEEKIVPAQVIPAHEEEIVEWDCKPILAKRRTTVEVQEPKLLETAEIPF